MPVPKTEQRAAKLLTDLQALKAAQATTSPTAAEPVTAALVKAVHALERAFRVTGYWNDFSYVAAGGRDWVTAYVGWSLLQTPHADREVIDQAGRFLERDYHTAHGWAYRPGLPRDADSTSWALLFLAESGADMDLTAARDELLRYQNPDGGFPAYPTPAAIGQYIGAGPETDLSAWCDSHLGVTCAAMMAFEAAGINREAPPLRKARAFVRQQQTAAGAWPSYWYYGRTYGTAHAVQVLRESDAAEDHERLRRARTWLEESQRPDGSWASGQSQGPGRPFDTALAIGALLTLPDTDRQCVRRGVDWLLDHQQPDGRWPSYPTLQLPAGSDHIPWEKESWPLKRWPPDGDFHGVCVPDENHFYTTATVIQALAAWTATGAAEA